MKTRTGMGAVAAAALLCASAGHADVVFNLTVEFSGAQQPANVPTAVFSDAGVDTVSLRLSFSDFAGGGSEYISEWYFNLDPLMDPNALLITPTGQSRTEISTTHTGHIQTGVDAFRADGDGLYDILFSFAPPPGGPFPGPRFAPGDWIEYEITGISGLTCDSFDFLSTPAGGHGPFPTAAHVQGVGPGGDGSGWVTVPIPQTAYLGFAGLALAAGVAAAKRRR